MKLTTRDLILCGIFASITAILSQISIPLPFTTVPLTMQTFAVGLTGVILGARKGFTSQLIYVLVGAVGLPVFAQMTGGMGIVLGPTGGYILGFPVMAFVIGYFKDKFDSQIAIIFGMILGLLIDYSLGTTMFILITKMTLMQALAYCVIPFIPLDLVKVVFVTILGTTLSKRLYLNKV